MELMFTVRERFGPQDGENWENYIRWANLPQLQEVIGLDASLCPSVFAEFLPEDWNYITYTTHFPTYFNNLEYLIRRVKKQIEIFNLLAVVHEPEEDPGKIFDDKRFVFYGYDLIEEGTNISALTNCGGFDDAFKNDQLSPVGLLESFSIARNVQKRLVAYYPDEPHAYCDLWAIWRLENLSL